MDECRLTQEQIRKLMNGDKIKVRYSAPEEFGRVGVSEIELVPIRIYCKECRQPVDYINVDGFCNMCTIPPDYGSYIDEEHGR